MLIAKFKNINLILVALLGSLLIHFFLFFSFRCYFKGREGTSPIIYSWLSILHSKDLYKNKGNPILPTEKIFSLDVTRSNYFKQQPTLYFSLSNQNTNSLPKTKEMVTIKQNVPTAYIHLWQKNTILPPEIKETILCRGAISKFGKIVFLYPKRLTLNPHAMILTQKYLRESVVFFPNQKPNLGKLHWTKIEEMIE